MRYRVVLDRGPTAPRVVLRRLAAGSSEPGLPLYAARWVQTLLERYPPSAGPAWLVRWRWWRTWRLLEAGLARLGYPGARAYLDLLPVDRGAGRGQGPPAAPADVCPAPDPAGLVRRLAGRILLEGELSPAAGAGGGDAALRAAEALVAAGRALRRAAVEVGPQGGWCVRCGSRDGVVADSCPRCGSASCPRCSRCSGMGVARGCMALYAMPFEPPIRPPAGEPEPEAPATLSPAQLQARAQLRRWVAARLASPHPSDSPGGCLVWAVTGAGKTEIAFGAIGTVLARGHAALFAAPRREVAVDVALRARAAFGPERVSLLVGRRPGQEASRAERAHSLALEGRLVVATTHQALRFFQAFSLVVLDEADAFPYAGCPMLEHAVQRSLRPEGFMAVMTATPGPGWLRRARACRWPVLLVPVRHHGHPLPVPELCIDGRVALWEQEPDQPGRVPPTLRDWMRRRGPGGRLLLFAPTVRLVEGVARALGIPACHSRQPRREEVTAAFAAGRVPALVASPVLERGLTFEGVDVAVLFAHREEIFDAGALVQMAGRCGRSARAPTGRVLLLAARKTRALQEAVRHIQAMNRLAARQAALLQGGQELAGGGGIMR